MCKWLARMIICLIYYYMIMTTNKVWSSQRGTGRTGIRVKLNLIQPAWGYTGKVKIRKRSGQIRDFKTNHFKCVHCGKPNLIQPAWGSTSKIRKKRSGPFRDLKTNVVSVELLILIQPAWGSTSKNCCQLCQRKPIDAFVKSLLPLYITNTVWF